jgi:hypothetical protein
VGEVLGSHGPTDKKDESVPEPETAAEEGEQPVVVEAS